MKEGLRDYQQSRKPLFCHPTFSWPLFSAFSLSRLSSDDVVYFDPALESKLGGKKALAAYYDMIRGKIGIDLYRMVDPVVQPASDAAVLTCDYEAHRDGRLFRMHSTEVYRRDSSGRWEIMHAHWSFVPPEE